MNDLRIILADDHNLMRAGLRTLLQTIPGVEVVGETGDGLEAIALAQSCRPKLALLDISMPGLNGLDAAARILHECPGTRVILISMHAGEEYVRQALRIGVSGYLLKVSDPSELRLAVETVARGEVYLSPSVSKFVVTAFVRGESSQDESPDRLSPRLREVLQLLAEGHRTKEIARLLNIRVRTVESHRAAIMETLQIHDIPGLVRYAIRMGLVAAE